VVSPTMHDVVVAAALTLSINDLMHVDETDPPTPAGLLVLPHAMLQVDAARDTADVRALLWSPITAYGPDGEQGPGLRVTAFLDANGPVRVATFDAFAEQARLRGEPLPPLVFDASQGLPFHYNKPVGPLVLAERALHVREQAERGRRAAEDTGHDASATVGEYTSGAPVDDTDESLSRRYLFAFWRLCEQHIAEITQAPLTHSAAATAARAGTSPQASVVTLRQRARVADQPATPSPYSGPRAGWCGCTKWTSGIPSSTPTASSGAAHTSKDPTGYPSNNPPSARWSVEPALRHAAADLCTARAAIRSCQAEILSSRAGRTSSAMTSPGSARHHSSSLANDVHG